MPLVVPDIGELVALASWLAGVAPTLTMRLYKNNYTPVDASILTDFTEANFSGYAAVGITMGSPSEVSNKAKSVATAPAVYTHNGGGTANTIYGYYIHDTVLNQLMWAERFGSSQIMTNNGDQISVTAVLTFDSENH